MVGIFDDLSSSEAFFDDAAASESEKTPLYDPAALWYRANMVTLAALQGQPPSSVDMQGLLQSYERTILNGQEGVVFKDIMANRRTRQVQLGEGLLRDQAMAPNTPENTELFLDTVNFYLGLDAEEEAAAEKAAAEQLLTATDPALEAAIEDAEAHGTALDRLRDLHAKYIMYEETIAQVSADVDDQGWVRDVTDFVGSFMPTSWFTAGAAARTAGAVSGGFFNPGDALLAAQSIMFGPDMSVEEFKRLQPQLRKAVASASGLFATNRTKVQEVIEGIRAASSGGAVAHNILRQIDIATLPFLATAKAMGRGVVSAARLAGNRRHAVKTAAETVAEGQRNDTVVNAAGVREAMEAMTPEAMTPTPDLVAGPGVSGEVLAKLQRSRDITAEVLGTLRPERLSVDDYEKAVGRAVDKLRGEVGNAPIADHAVTVDPVSGVRKVRVDLGVPDTVEGFATREGAVAGAHRYGFEDGSFEVVEADGLFFVRVDRVVDESGVVTGYDPTDIPFGARAVGGVAIRSFISGADSLLPRTITNATHLAVDVRTRLHTLVAELARPAQQLPRADRKRITAALVESESQQKWLDVGELRRFWDDKFGREISDKEMAGYYTMKDLNDLGHYVLNSAEYSKRAVRGMKTVSVEADSFRLDPQNASVLETVDTPELKYWTKISAINEPAENFAPGQITAAEVRRLVDEEGYHIIKIEKAHIHNGQPIEYILARRGTAEIRELNPHQLPYVAGGHRMYEGNYFVKQAVFNILADGRRIVLNPLTHHVFTSLQAAKNYTSQLERARLAFVAARDGNISTAEATREIAAAGIGVRTFDDFKRLVGLGRVRADTPFEAMFDRELPSAMRREANDYLATNPDLEGVSGWYADTGRMYYGHKGERLRDPQGDLAPILDPFETSKRAMENMVLTRAFGDYRTRVVDEWMATYGKYLTAPREATSPLQRFMQGTIHAPDSATQAQADGIRRTILRMLSTPTRDAVWARDATRKVAEWVDAAPGGKRIGKFVLDKRSKNPVNALKSFAFDLYLGLGDLSQLILQPMTVFAAVSVAPLYGLKGVFAYPFLRMALINTDEGFLGGAAKSFATASKGLARGTGWSADDLKQMARDFRASGKGEISGELTILDNFSDPQAGNLGARSFKKARHMARIPFYEGERINRIVAYAMSWQEWHKLNPGVKELTQEGAEFISKRSNDYSMNMTTAGSAWWQKGALSVPTQFMSYQARMIEAMLPKFAGGSGAFTPRQRAQLFIGQMLLFGQMGILPVQTMWLVDRFEKNTGIELSQDQILAVTGGLIDSIIWGLSSDEHGDPQVRSDWASRAGLWGQGGGILADIFSSDSSMVEILGGPALQAISSTVEAFRDFAQIARASSGADHELIGELALNVLQESSSAWSRYSRAAWIWEYGLYLDSRGRARGAGRLTKMEAVAAALGVPLREVNDTYRLQRDTREREEYIRDRAQMMHKLFMEGFMDPSKAAHVSKLLRQLFPHVDPLEREQIRQRAARMVPDDVYQEAFERNMRLKRDSDPSNRWHREYLQRRQELIARQQQPEEGR